MITGASTDLGSNQQAGQSGELHRLLDEAVDRLLAVRRTFTEEEALGSVWEAGYEVSPQTDPRFVLAREADGKHPRQWRLAVHRLANDRLLNALADGTWDGHDLDAELARLSAQDHVHYVFCPLDQRYSLRADGVLERADREETIELPEDVKAELDVLGSELIKQWAAAGGEPWTVRQVTETLGHLGWPQTERREAWLLVRSWLATWPEVARVGHDYWAPTDQLPSPPEETRLRVLPLVPRREVDQQPLEAANEAATSQGAPVRNQSEEPEETQMLFGGQNVARSTTWMIPLRTVHLVGGFVPVPALARGAYPARGQDEGGTTALRGLWFETGEHLWIWLDREHDRLYGPQLADQLAWCEAGDLLRIEWTPDAIVLRLVGHDAEVQAEETRLVDVEALAALRGGLGESYRASLQAILEQTPDGLTFPEVVASIRERQGHAVHRGTIRAVLHAGGFVQREGRWFAAPETAVGARHLRAAIVDAIVSPDAKETLTEASTSNVRLRARAQGIRNRLSYLVDELTNRLE